MKKLEFRSNSDLSMGVEIEIQIVDPQKGDLKPLAPLLLDKIKKYFNDPHIKSEIFQSMLEIDTPICTTAQEVGVSLRRSLQIVQHLAAASDAQIVMAGTHPFAHYTERHLTADSRYYHLVDRNQWIARRLQIFGLHIHLGMRSGEHAIAMNNALCHYLPMVLAMSASSPFWNSQDTGLASSRITFFEAIPTGGHPYLLNSWTEFENLIHCLITSQSISSLKDLWWDIRPNADFGTIEIRIADCPPTLKETEAIVAFVHALALFLDKELSAGRKFAPPPEWILRENKWRASRHGVDCELITDQMGTSTPFSEVWVTTRNSLKEICQIYNYGDYFECVDRVISKGPSYVRQRQHQQQGLQSVIQHLVRECKTDSPEWSS